MMTIIRSHFQGYEQIDFLDDSYQPQLNLSGRQLDDSLKFWEQETVQAEASLSKFVQDFSSNVQETSKEMLVIDTFLQSDEDEAENEDESTDQVKSSSVSGAGESNQGHGSADNAEKDNRLQEAGSTTLLTSEIGDNGLTESIEKLTADVIPLTFSSSLTESSIPLTLSGSISQNFGNLDDTMADIATLLESTSTKSTKN